MWAATMYISSGREVPIFVQNTSSLVPGVDGCEATRRLKSNPKAHDIPVIALSAHAMEGERARALGAGCDDFDTKPVDFPRLLEKIRTLLAKNAGP